MSCATECLWQLLVKQVGVCSQKTISDSQKTISDSQKTISDSQKTISDSQKTFEFSEKTTCNHWCWGGVSTHLSQAVCKTIQYFCKHVGTSLKNILNCAGGCGETRCCEFGGIEVFEHFLLPLLPPPFLTLGGNTPFLILLSFTHLTGIVVFYLIVIGVLGTILLVINTGIFGFLAGSWDRWWWWWWWWWLW